MKSLIGPEIAERQARIDRELGAVAGLGGLGPFRAVWHPEGRMTASWFQGAGEEFIRVSCEGSDRGGRILHFLGGTTGEVGGSRAVVQTKTTVSQGGEVEGVVCDVVCTGRFYDFLEKHDGRWTIVLRQPIYEKDRLDPVIMGTGHDLAPDLLAAFPEGYRHLAYLQSRIGYPVKPDMPRLARPAVEALYARGAAWLDSSASSLPQYPVTATAMPDACPRLKSAARSRRPGGLPHGAVASGEEHRLLPH